MRKIKVPNNLMQIGNAYGEVLYELRDAQADGHKNITLYVDLKYERATIGKLLKSLGDGNDPEFEDLNINVIFK